MYRILILPHVANCGPELVGPSRWSLSDHSTLFAWMHSYCYFTPDKVKYHFEGSFNKHISRKLQLAIFIFLSPPYFGSTEEKY